MSYEPKRREVLIIRRGNQAVVWPPYLVATQGDYITFKTVGLSSKIEFPLDLPFEENNSTHSPTEAKPAWKGVENAKGGNEAIIRVEMNSAATVKLKGKMQYDLSGFRDADGLYSKYAETMLWGNTQVYAYSAFCQEINDFAEGNSSPVIIIEPPERPPG